jgi:hypothetical protein
MVEDIVNGFFESIGWGVGGAVVAATVLIGGSQAKPLAKGAIKGYLTATRRVREATAEASETLQDIYAEAKHEYESQLRPTGAAGAETGGPVNIPIQHDETA